MSGLSGTEIVALSNELNCGVRKVRDVSCGDVVFSGGEYFTELDFTDTSGGRQFYTSKSFLRVSRERLPVRFLEV